MQLLISTGHYYKNPADISEFLVKNDYVLYNYRWHPTNKGREARAYENKLKALPLDEQDYGFLNHCKLGSIWLINQDVSRFFKLYAKGFVSIKGESNGYLVSITENGERLLSYKEEKGKPCAYNVY